MLIKEGTTDVVCDIETLEPVNKKQTDKTGWAKKEIRGHANELINIVEGVSCTSSPEAKIPKSRTKRSCWSLSQQLPVTPILSDDQVFLGAGVLDQDHAGINRGHPVSPPYASVRIQDHIATGT